MKCENHISEAELACKDMFHIIEAKLYEGIEHLKWILDTRIPVRVRASGWGRDLTAGTLCVLERRDGAIRDITNEWRIEDAW